MNYNIKLREEVCKEIIKNVIESTPLEKVTRIIWDYYEFWRLTKRAKRREERHLVGAERKIIVVPEVATYQNLAKSKLIKMLAPMNGTEMMPMYGDRIVGEFQFDPLDSHIFTGGEKEKKALIQEAKKTKELCLTQNLLFITPNLSLFLINVQSLEKGRGLLRNNVYATQGEPFVTNFSTYNSVGKIHPSFYKASSLDYLKTVEDYTNTEDTKRLGLEKHCSSYIIVSDENLAKVIDSSLLELGLKKKRGK